MEIKNIPIGEVLKEYGYITDAQLSEALEYQKENRGKRLGGILIELGFISENQMLMALAQRLQLKIAELSTLQVDIDAVARIPQQLAKKYRILAVAQSDNMLRVVTNDPLNFYGLEDVSQVAGIELEIQLAQTKDLDRAIDYYYSEVSARTAARKANTSIQEELEEIEVDESDSDAPVIRLLNSLIQRAYSSNASDIHIEPFENKTQVRMRLDGTIVDYVTLQRALHAPLIARIKILSDLDIAERRLPQDGHFRLRLDSEYINIRVSVIPTVFGEKAVLRLLANNSVVDHPDAFGMNEESCQKFTEILKSPNGIIYLTGPTGSGKTTTLYMVLAELVKRQVNIATIEDPVEKNLDGVNQMQVNNMAGLTFEVGLRAILRQDPDIIMVGETRDSETAEISIRSAITGHLVFSTLHTNNAVSSIIRLIDMGLEPYMIANSVAGIVAQRLMRKVCPHCCEEIEATELEQTLTDGRVEKVKKAHGCNQCHYTGYSGRIAIHEIVVIDKTIRGMISRKADMEEISEYAINKQGMVTLREAGLELVARGVTTMEEYLKVAYNF